MQVLSESWATRRNPSLTIPLTAHTAIALARYMILALEQRRNTNERGIGGLFYLTIDEMEYLCYLKALASLLIDCTKEAEILDEEQVDQLLGLFVANLHHLWRGKVPETVCVM